MPRSQLLIAAVLAALAPVAKAEEPAGKPSEQPSPPAASNPSVKTEAKPQEGTPAAGAPFPKLPFTIYGTLNVNGQWSEARGATVKTADVKPRTLVSVDSSNIGIKGTYDVPGNLQIAFQCETGAQVNGSFNASLCNRNSRIGLGSPRIGTLFFGNWDTPYKSGIFGTKADDPFSSTDVWDHESILTSPGFNTKTSGWSSSSSSTVTSFAVRNNNTVAFHSASFSGGSFKLAYGTDAFKNASGTQDPTLYSAGVNYDRGPLSVLAGYEQHRDGFGLVALNPAGMGGAPTAPPFGATAANTSGSATAALHETDTAWHAGAGWEQAWGGAGTTTVGGLVEQLSYRQPKAAAGAVKRYSRLAWQVSLKHRIGPHELRFRFSSADKGKASLAGGAAANTSGYGATDLAVGYAYWLSATGQVYLQYTRIQNQRRAQYAFGTAGPYGGTNQPVVAAGADPQALGLGIRYGF